MSTSKTYQQSFADVGSETRPPMLERGSYIPWFHDDNLQSEWLKYVTQVRLAKRLTVDTFDDLFDYLQQFKKLVNVSRAKKLEKSHDPLALVAHTGSSSRNTSSYYVTHPSLWLITGRVQYLQDVVSHQFEDPSNILQCVTC
ncbi:hypothetical protein Tco_1122969 [Tanacetum coccineum]|uniref:Uncharacterized protein n=1 Tax=Tanacetum coccineum TaxID=301880 RepID=A0ABQ5J5S6_9ASTR